MPQVYWKKAIMGNAKINPNPYLCETCNRPIYIISVKQMAVY